MHSAAPFTDPRKDRVVTGAATRSFAALTLALAAGLGSCRSPDMDVVRRAYYAGDHDRALERLEEYERRDPRNRDRWELEKSIVHIATGDLDLAQESLRSVRDSLAKNSPGEQRAGDAPGSLARAAEALLVDDTALRYQLRDYEQQLVYGLLAAVEAVRGGADAQAYSLQALERALRIQAEFVDDTITLFRSIDEYRDVNGDNPKEAYRLVGFGDFVRATLLEESPTRVDEAERAYVRAFQLSPDYPYVEQDLARVRGEVRQKPGTGALYVLALTGRGPILEERVIDHPAESILLIVKQVWSYRHGHSSFPIVTGIRIPELRFATDNPREVHVAVDGVPAGVTGTLTDIERTAEIEFEALHETILARAVLRRALKLVAGEVAKNQLEPVGRDRFYFFPGFLIDLVVALWSSAEEADLRSWSLLPARLQALRIELAPGEHTIQLRAGTQAGQPAGRTVEQRVRIHAGFNTYVITAFPTITG